MNSQIFPGLSESFIHQEHQQLLAEAAKARLLAKPSKSSKLFYLLHREQNLVAQPAQTSTPQPSVSRAVVFAVLTAFSAMQIAQWMAF